MKREIKFRAWIPNLKRIIYIGSHKNDTAVWICEDGFNVVDHFTGSHESLGTDEDGVILMQFTGLKDKNGKEIDEGDVWLMNGIKSQPMIVCFDNGKFISKSTWGEYLKRDDGYTYWDFIDGEVIGNIYENPELLSK